MSILDKFKNVEITSDTYFAPNVLSRLKELKAEYDLKLRQTREDITVMEGISLHDDKKRTEVLEKLNSDIWSYKRHFESRGIEIVNEYYDINVKDSHYHDTSFFKDKEIPTIEDLKKFFILKLKDIPLIEYAKSVTMDKMASEYSSYYVKEYPSVKSGSVYLPKLIFVDYTSSISDLNGGFISANKICTSDIDNIRTIDKLINLFKNDSNDLCGIFDKVCFYDNGTIENGYNRQYIPTGRINIGINGVDSIHVQKSGKVLIRFIDKADAQRFYDFIGADSYSRDK